MKSVLDVIVKDLDLSPKHREKLLRDLRDLNITDDNDMLARITLIQSILARYIGAVPARLTYERLMFEKLAKEQIKESREIRRILEDVKKVGKAWHDESLIEAEKRLERTRNDTQEAEEKLISVRSAGRKTCWNVFTVVAVITIIGFCINYFYTYESIAGNYKKRQYYLEKSSKTPEIVTVDGGKEPYVMIVPNSGFETEDGGLWAKVAGYND